MAEIPGEPGILDQVVTFGSRLLDVRFGLAVLLIPGTSSLAHLEDNLAVADVQLDADQFAELDGVTGGP